MSLGGPLPRAQSPRAGRVLSRGKDCRATEPPMASRPIRVTPATAAPAVPSTIHLRALRLRRARRERRKSLGRPHLCSDAYELTPSRARLFAFFGLSELYRSSLPQFPLAGHIDRATPSVGLCAHEQDDFGPPPRRPSTSCRSRHRLVLISCPLRPSPAVNVRRCGSRRLRGNPPAAGPPLRSGPGAKQASLGCLSRRPPHFRARRRGNRPPPGHKKGPVSWLLSDQ